MFIGKTGKNEGGKSVIAPVAIKQRAPPRTVELNSNKRNVYFQRTRKEHAHSKKFFACKSGVRMR